MLAIAGVEGDRKPAPTDAVAAEVEPLRDGVADAIGLGAALDRTGGCTCLNCNDG